MEDDIRKMVADVTAEMIELRRDFHRHPELSMQENRTAAKVAEYLDSLGLPLRTAVGQTGVVGLLQGRSPGRTLILRADMDGLPIQELGDVPYRSVNDGVMHACGHDGHTAVLMAVAKILCGLRERFDGAIKFVFQPGEEGFMGARAMVEDGVMDNPRVDAAIGMHFISTVPVGLVGIKAGALMASADRFHIDVYGKGGHAGMPDEGVDAVLISAAVIQSLQSLISKETSPTAPLVVHVGKVHGGSAFNIVADRIAMEGTVRTLNTTLQQGIPERMDRIVKGIVDAYRGTHKLDYIFGAPMVINDPALTELVREAAVRSAGAEAVIEPPSVMGSEDFSFFTENVPGHYFIVGAGNEARDCHHPHHNPYFNIDEDALPVAAEIMIRSALDYLGQGQAS